MYVEYACVYFKGAWKGMDVYMLSVFKLDKEEYVCGICMRIF